MNSEEKLFISLIKGNITAKEYENINWNEFIKLAYYHRITGFIAKKLNKKLVSKKTIKQINELNKIIISKNLILNNEMISLFKEFKIKGIEVIAIKGMALNHFIYPESFSRVSSDVDFLIKEKDYFKIKKISGKKGFKESKFWLRELLFYHHYPILEKQVNGLNCMIEPHKELIFPVNPFKIDLQEIWDNRIEINNIFIPSIEDSFILTALSSVYQHNFYGIFEGLIDAKNLMKKNINHTKLKEKTEKYKVIEIMIYFNELIKEVFGTEIKGIKNLEEKADKKKLDYLKENSLEKIIKMHNKKEIDSGIIKNRFYWAKGTKQKIKVLIFVLNHKILSGTWKLRKKERQIKR